MRIKGIVSTGDGTGKYFMSISNYQKEFVRTLGYLPFAGTLNLFISPADVARVRERLKGKHIHINGFMQDNTLFWSVDLLPASLKDSRCALVFPGHNPQRLDVLQLISDDFLRQRHNLKDGDSVEVEVLD